MLQNLVSKKDKLAVIGLGYVGLPVALAFARKFSVIGFDTDEARISLMQQGIDPANEMNVSAFAGSDIQFTSNPGLLTQASFYIVSVPTPVDEHNVPFLGHLLDASALIGSVISKGDYVVFESTVYPGCTEEDCIPVIEKNSGFAAGIDFKYGYSPERINLGDKEHTLEKIIKVVSGCDEDSLQEIAGTYETIIEAGVHRASSVKVAEAAKIIENTQRDLNIALMNELSIIFNKMGLNTNEVLAAAGTKWNFLPFKPGLVGGHCIGVDPYYLTYKAAELGYNAKVILAGRVINDSMGTYVAKNVLQHIIKFNGNVKESKVLVMGATFKENVKDSRNSKTADVVKELKSYSINVDVVDPYASSEALVHEYGFGLAKQYNNYDAVIVTVIHQEYSTLDEGYFSDLLKPNGLLADVKGYYRNRISSLHYWSL
ncbi:MAG: nucleotide sugar dehydrogenase [Bacteroidota bacterium]